MNKHARRRRKIVSLPIMGGVENDGVTLLLRQLCLLLEIVHNNDTAEAW